MLWSEMVPDIFVQFDQIVFKQNQDTKTFDFFLSKEPEQLKVKALEFLITATPKRIELTGPKAYPLPVELPTQKPLQLRDFKLVALIEKKSIPIEIMGLLEVAPFKLTSEIDLPLKADFTSTAFIKKVLLKTEIKVAVTNIKKNLATLAPPPFNELPAPLNAMEGAIEIKVSTQKPDEAENKKSIIIHATTDIDFESSTQALKLGLNLTTPFNLEDYSLGKISVRVDFRKV
jgi:hypothetical protein